MECAGLEILAERSDIAVLFTDIVMLEMNGRALAEEALILRPNLEVVYATGFSQNGIIHNGILDPDVHFIPKPFTVELLAREVAAVLQD
jgi:DNA-binding NtrC family response regulator